MYNRNELGNDPRQKQGAMCGIETEGEVGDTTAWAFVPGIETGPKRPRFRSRDKAGQSTSGGI